MKNWINVEDKLPNDDREVLIYVRNLSEPHWSDNKIGAYINNRWYARSGLNSEEVVAKWLDIPEYIDFRTGKDWNKIYNKLIDLDNWKNYETELISEKDFTSKLLK